MANISLTNETGRLDALIEVFSDGETLGDLSISERMAWVLRAYSDTQKAIADDYQSGESDWGLESSSKAYIHLDDYDLALEGSFSFFGISVSRITITKKADGSTVTLTGSFVYSGTPTAAELPNGSTISSIEVRQGNVGGALSMTATYSNAQVSGTVTSVTASLYGGDQVPVLAGAHYAEVIAGNAPFVVSGVATASPQVSFGAGSFDGLTVGLYDEGSKAFVDHVEASGWPMTYGDVPRDVPDLSGADTFVLHGAAGVDVDSEAGADSILGGAGPDSVHAGPGSDTVAGGGSGDLLAGDDGFDVAAFVGTVADYTLVRDASGLSVSDGIAARDGSDRLHAFELLKFADMEVSLTVQEAVTPLPVEALDRICELYVGFFGRVPAAKGLENWANQYRGGKSLDRIADDFYGIGSSPQLRSYTGYWDTTNDRELSNEDYVAIVYRNVLGREGLESGIRYWADQLSGPGAKTRGELVSTMLDAAHGLKGNVDWGWVADLLDARILMSKRVAMEWGLNYAATDQQAIEKGMAIAASVDEHPNPNPAYASIPVKTFDFDGAVALVGVNPEHIDLM